MPPRVPDPTVERIKKHVAAVGKKYPGVWKIINKMRQERGKGLPEWADWCYAPLSAAYAVASHGQTPIADSAIQDVGTIAALAAWRVTQGIYRFHPALFPAVWQTPIDRKIPIELLYNLPEWCVYIETPGQHFVYLRDRLFGFFAHLEEDAGDGHVELRFVLDVDSGLFPVPLHLVSEGLAESIERALDYSQKSMDKHGEHLSDSDKAALLLESRSVFRGIAHEYGPWLSLVLYLCSVTSEVRESGGVPGNLVGRLPGRPKRG